MRGLGLVGSVDCGCVLVSIKSGGALRHPSRDNLQCWLKEHCSRAQPELHTGSIPCFN